MPRLAIAVALLLVSASTASGHDLWLLPPETADADKTVRVRVAQGMDFPKSTGAPDPARFSQARVFDPSGRAWPLVAAPITGDVGTLTFAPRGTGVHVAFVDVAPRDIDLDAEAFNAYLVSDGLPHVYRARQQDKRLDEPGRERYQKSVKVLVPVGGIDEGWKQRTHQLLEIVPERSPFALTVGDTLPFRVYFEGKPLADARVGWDHPDDGPEFSGTVRTDGSGRALAPVAKTGLMTLRLTHMAYDPRRERPYHSFWSTMTFFIPPSASK